MYLPEPHLIRQYTSDGSPTLTVRHLSSSRGPLNINEGHRKTQHSEWHGAAETWLKPVLK